MKFGIQSMKKLIIFMYSLAALAQTPTPPPNTNATGTITITVNGKSLTWDFLLLDPITPTALTCDVKQLAPGDESSCSITLSAPARSSMVAYINVPVGFGVNPASPLAIQPGDTTVKFKVVRSLLPSGVALIAVPKPLFGVAAVGNAYKGYHWLDLR